MAPLAHWWKQLSPAAALPTHPAEQAPASVDLSILVCCYKYLQRFRIFLQSIVRQQHPLERIEVCIVAPGNPDGLYEYMNVVRLAHPALRFRLIEVDAVTGANKGKMLNAGFRASSGPVIMVADGDLVLGPDFVSHMLSQYQPERILGCWRTPLNKTVTAHIVCGNLDPVENFAELRKQWDQDEAHDGVRQGMLGYCQIVSRAAFERVGYPEEFEGFNQSDIVFIERLQAIGLRNHFLQDHFVLHLSHHRDWTGTKVFL